MDKKLKDYMKAYVQSNLLLIVFSLLVSCLCYVIGAPTPKKADTITLGRYHYNQPIFQSYKRHS